MSSFTLMALGVVLMFFGLGLFMAGRKASYGEIAGGGLAMTAGLLAIAGAYALAVIFLFAALSVYCAPVAIRKRRGA